jgi:hypothetical protein
MAIAVMRVSTRSGTFPIILFILFGGGFYGYRSGYIGGGGGPGIGLILLIILRILLLGGFGGHYYGRYW